MEDKINEFRRLENEIKEEVKTFVQDKSKPLEERWHIFCLADMGEMKTWYEDFKALTKILGRAVSYYDDFGIERYETFEVATFFERRVIQDATEELQNELKEEILDKFIYSFEFDW